MNHAEILKLQPGDRCVFVFRSTPAVPSQSGQQISLTMLHVNAVFRQYVAHPEDRAKDAVVVQLGKGETADVLIPLADIYLGRPNAVTTVQLVKP